MYGFTQRLFPVPYEWGRLARVVLVAAALVGLGELLMPTSGAVGLLGRAALWPPTRSPSSPPASSPPTSAAGSAACATPRELARRASSACAPQPAAVDGRVPEAYEAERMDEDSPRL